MKVTEIKRKTFLATLAKRPLMNQATPYIWLGKRGLNSVAKCVFKEGIHLRLWEAVELGIPADADRPQFVGLFQDKRGFVYVVACSDPSTRNTPSRFFKFRLER